MAATVQDICAMVRTELRLFPASLLFLFTLLSAPPLPAEPAAKMPIAWAPVYPLIHEDRNGEVSGFMVDLSQELGREVGFEPAFFRVASLSEWLDAQSTGASSMIFGGPLLPAFAQSNVASVPVFTQIEQQLTIRVEDSKKIKPFDVAGLKIGVVPPGAMSDPAIYPGANVIVFDSVSSALFDLLAGDIDAVAIPSIVSYATARAARLDHRITIVGPATLQSDRFVVIHQKHADLLAPINAALAQMETDGRLQALLTKHNLIIPEGEPDVLTVGVTDFPPYSVYNDDGTYSGFAVDAFADLAALAGLNIKFNAISDEEFAAGPTAATYDILPQVAMNPARAEIMDFALPVQKSALSIFTRAGQAEGISDLDSLVGRTIGVERVNLGRRLAEGHGGLTIRLFDGRPALLQALRDGQVEAILFPSAAMTREIDAQGLAGEIEELKPSFYTSLRAPALRRGLGSVRERLNAVIPGYLISDEYEAIQDKWFGVPVFWTANRINVALGTTGLALLGLVGLLGWSRYKQRQQQFIQQRRELKQEQRHSRELAKLITELERSNGELDNFAYVASHDLKEPLRGIAINADFLLREEVSEKGKERIERMVHLTTRMEQLISDLLFFSRLGRADKAKETLNLAHLIKGIKTGLREMLEETGGTIEVESGLPLVYAEPATVKILFQNLIVNGVKYNSADRKVIRIGFLAKAQVQGKTLHNVFYVRDNGVGIASKEHEKIFRIFTRLNREADFGRGTGAGLAFVKKIIVGYGGLITLSSEPGQGTTFYFSLPLVELNPQKNGTDRDLDTWTQLQPS